MRTAVEPKEATMNWLRQPSMFTLWSMSPSTAIPMKENTTVMRITGTVYFSEGLKGFCILSSSVGVFQLYKGVNGG